MSYYLKLEDSPVYYPIPSSPNYSTCLDDENPDQPPKIKLSQSTSPETQNIQQAASRCFRSFSIPVQKSSDSNLCKFFQALSEQIPEDKQPRLPDNLSARSQTIRDWMENSEHRKILTTISNLSLADLELTDLPSEIGQLASLTALNLANNNLVTIPR